MTTADFRPHRLAEKATTLPRDYYVSREILAEERERLFARDWLCVGRADRIPSAGDYFLAEIAGESLIVVRGGDGCVRAFFNVCRHRGTRLCERDEGRFARAIVCPYHSWSYALDGALLAAPNMGETPWFDASKFPLTAAAADVWEGFVFLRLPAAGAPLAEALRPLVGRFASWRLPSLATVRRIVYDVRANWKLLFQNFSECDHCPPVHPALARLSPYRSGFNDLREGAVLGGYMLLSEPSGSLTASGRICAPRLAEVPESERGRVYYYSILPSLLLTIQPDLVMSTRLEPIDVDRTRVVSEFHVAPGVAEDAELDVDDGIAFWDTTNRQDWHVCELAQQGVSSRAYVPGVYAKQESLLAAFDREYLRRLRGDAAGLSSGASEG